MTAEQAEDRPMLSHDAKIGDIQVVRGLSILMVLFCHLSIGATSLKSLPVQITMPFGLGVDIFFVVSGYVITRSLMKDGFHGPRFFVKRIFRLMPALLCFIVLTLFLNRYVQQAAISDGAKAMLSVENRVFRQQARGIAFGYLTFVSPGPSYVNGAMWSLSVEDQFYAGATLICAATGLLRLGRRWAGALLGLSAGALYLYLTGWRLAHFWHAATPHWIVQYLNCWRFDFLALGVVLAFADVRFSERIRIAFQHNGTYCSAFLLMLPLIIAAVCESPNDGPAPVLHSVGYTLIGLCFAGIVLLAANGLAFPVSRGRIYHAIKSVGDRSYTYYLFHYPMFVVAWLLIQRFSPRIFDGLWSYAFAQAAIVAVLLTPFAEIVYRGIELPFAELGRKIAAKMKPGKLRLAGVDEPLTVTVGQRKHLPPAILTAEEFTSRRKAA